MKYLLLFLALTSSLFSVDSLESWFSEGSVKGNVKYYYIQTNVEKLDGDTVNAYANSIGGQLSYTTADWAGFSTGVTLMTTNGFLLPSDSSEVESSILSRDNGVRLDGAARGDTASESFSVLGEVFVQYNYKDITALYGRKVITTPLVNAKEVRMLPSAVQGGFLDYKVDSLTFGASYLTDFKQRTSDRFINIVEHALGVNTELITGSKNGEVIVIDVAYKGENTRAQVYNYYADDFMNSFYADVSFKNKINSDWSYNAAAQYINQVSIGHADEYLNNSGSVTGAKQISSNTFGLKMGLGFKEASLGLAFTKVLKNDNKHDSLVLPWDGTPLFTNMITSNGLFQSNYGDGLIAQNIYIGGAASTKIAYTQGYDFTGVKGFKTVLSYLYIKNSLFLKDQEDFNAVAAYSVGDFSLILKAILVQNNTAIEADGSLLQVKDLNQYRVIANYKF